MKSLITISILFASLTVNAQSFQVEVYQYGKKVKTTKQTVDIDKATFTLVFKFKETININLIAGNDSTMKNTHQSNATQIEELVGKAGFGGADSYFNEGLSIKTWNAKVNTGIEYKDDEHHSFDSIHKKGKWIYGFRTVEKLSTPHDYLFVEEWQAPILIIAVANCQYTQQAKLLSDGMSIQLNLKEIESKSIYDVKGKEFIEEGEAVWQDGCEGCGNLGYFHFIKNGRNVDFLLSGSDTGSFSTYTQVGNQVTIGKEISFTISPDGKTLTDNKYKIKYSIQDK